jgi:hypothetical protein
VENKVGAVTISKYEYANDALGRREYVIQTGSAFGQAAFDDWAYNDRSELTGSKRYLGTDPNDTSQPVIAEHFVLDYDPIGNRETYTVAYANPPTSYTTNALNQYTATAAPAEAFTYDLDGNLTQDSTYT